MVKLYSFHYLGYNNTGNVGFIAILEAIKKNRSISYLNLSILEILQYHKIGDKDIRDRSLGALLDFINTKASLIELDLRVKGYDYHPTFPEKEIKKLEEKLQQLKHTKVILKIDY